jgi:hypothetical protein
MAGVAVLAAMAAFLRPMDARMESFDTRFQTIERAMAVQQENINFMKSLEAQLGALSERVDVNTKAVALHTGLEWHATAGEGHATMRTRIEAQDRLIRSLWRKVYGEPLP